jgi:hypothetical protein
MLMRRALKQRVESERGAVIVLVGIWMPVLALLVMFAIDTAHWWDYSRNLQMRADAAALAGGDQIGGTCFAASPPPASLANIGQIAQLYSGADQASSDLYPYVPRFGTGFPGSSLSPGPNFPNLKAGTLDHYHVLLNSTRFWQNGDPAQASSTLSFTMGSFCNATDENGNTGPIVDVRVTQDHLRLLLPLLGLRPTISAHARVELRRAVGEDLIRAIAVRDPTPNCLYVNVVYANGPNANQVYKTVQLTLDPTGDPNNPSASLFDNPAGTDVQMSPGVHFYLQPLLSDTDCNSAPSGTTYDSSTNSGLEYINTYGSATPGATENPAITTGGVFLNGSCTPDQYFSSQSCTVGVTANVAFGVPYTDTSGKQPAQFVTATDTSTGTKLTLSKLVTSVSGNQTVAAGAKLQVDSSAGFSNTGSIDVDGSSYLYTSIDATHFTLSAGGSFTNNFLVTQTGDNRWTSGIGGFAIGAESGQHPISISWEQRRGSITTLGPCDSTGQNPCQASLGVQQQAFSSCGGCDPPDDSGPLVAMRVRLKSDAPGTSGRNAFSNTDQPTLIFEVVTQAIRYDTPSTPPHIIRVSVQADNATGLLNCGQGTGASAATTAIQFGCPVYTDTANCKDVNYCAPYKVYPITPHANGVCDPLSRQDGSTYADCVATNSESGNKIVIVSGIANRIADAQGNCSANHWPDFVAGAPFQGDTDPRAISLVITAPADLSQNDLRVPIRNFGTFYVTGWYTGGGANSCNPSKLYGGTFGNEAFPGTGKDKPNGAIWGHWIQYTDPNAIPSETLGCPPSFFGLCVPVLSR